VTTHNRFRALGAAACCAALFPAALSAPAGAASSLGAGKYRCYQFDPTSGYLYWGKAKISGGKYKISAGSGKYRLSGKKVKWTSGPLKRYKWTGEKVSAKKFRILGKADHIKINCNR